MGLNWFNLTKIKRNEGLKMSLKQVAKLENQLRA